MGKALGVIFRWLSAVALVILLALVGFLWLGNYHPAAVETMPVACAASAPQLDAGQTLKVLTWNVQTMSGKNYVFWSDLPGNDGPDEKPSAEDVSATFDELVRVVKDESPDILLIQEIDTGAERTYYEDQLARLSAMLPEYPCVTSAFDWKSAYVPHPRIHGSVGWKVAIFSKYQISLAERLQLSSANKSFLEDQFKIQPAILKAHLPMTNGGEFVALTLHLDLYVPGSNAKDLQMAEINQVLRALDANNTPWLLGGDFNLLPPDQASYARLSPPQQKYYNPQSEIVFLTDRYAVVPSLEETSGSDYAKWLTRWPNDPAIPGPDRTLDYFFVSKGLAIGEYFVRMQDTLHISDHLPVILQVQLPE